MYCQSCGSQVEAGNKFCESCGEGIEVEVQTNVESSNRKDKVTDSLNMLREKINVSRTEDLVKMIASAVGLGIIVIVLVSFFGFGGTKYINIVKQGSFDSYPTVEIGKAFNQYFSNAEWEAFESTRGDQVVEFTGQCYFLDELTDVTMQFVIYSDETFSVEYLSFDNETQGAWMTTILISTVMEDYLLN